VWPILFYITELNRILIPTNPLISKVFIIGLLVTGNENFSSIADQEDIMSIFVFTLLAEYNLESGAVCRTH